VASGFTKALKFSTTELYDAILVRVHYYVFHLYFRFGKERRYKFASFQILRALLFKK